MIVTLISGYLGEITPTGHPDIEKSNACSSKIFAIKLFSTIVFLDESTTMVPKLLFSNAAACKSTDLIHSL